MGTLAFGASAQSVGAHPAFGREIDLQSIYDYLFFHMIPCPGTIYRGIHKLLPGECLVFENGAARRSFYWQADYRPVPGKDFAAYRTEFRDLLGAVRQGNRWRLEARQRFFPAAPTVPRSSAA